MTDYVIEAGRDGANFVVTDTWRDTTRQAFLASGPDLAELTLNYARGFRERSLDFLVGLPVQRLAVLSRTLTDLSPIYSLAATLEGLSVEAGDVTVQLDRLPLLRSVFAGWDAVADSIEAAAELRTFGAMGYRELDLTALTNSKLLSRIVLKAAPGLESLNGIAQFTQLEELWIQGAGRLHDVSGLRSAGRNLVSLRLECCPRVDSLEDFGGLTGLRMLEVGDCGPIASVVPVERLTLLERFWAWGTTRVADHDLSPLMRLPRLMDVRMRDRAEYQPRLGDFVDPKTLQMRGRGQLDSR